MLDKWGVSRQITPLEFWTNGLALSSMLVLCHNLVLGLGATGFASADSLAAVQKSTGRASGTQILRCDTARGR